MARETAKETWGKPASVSNVLSNSGVGGATLWGGDLGFVGGNVKKTIEDAHGFPQTVDRSEGHAEGDGTWISVAAAT